MADNGSFFMDTRTPFVTSNGPVVTLAATAKAIYTTSQFPTLGGNYFGYAGKKVRIRAFGQVTTGLTPGNGSFNVYYGSGADATGVVLMTGTPVALLPSQTNLTWVLELVVTCRSVGSAGTLFCTGRALFNPSVVASAMLLPASNPAVSGACDLTAANIISVQFLRSGSTAETMQVVEMEVMILN